MLNSAETVAAADLDALPHWNLHLPLYSCADPLSYELIAARIAAPGKETWSRPTPLSVIAYQKARWQAL